MYVSGTTGLDVNQYTLSTAWDISTASYVRLFGVGSEENTPQGLFFSPDGLNMYIVGTGGRDVNQYTLSTAWDISTATFTTPTTDYLPVSGSFIEDLYLRADGLRAYVLFRATRSVFEYSLGTAWEIHTATYTQAFSIAAQETGARGLFFSPDGLNMYVSGTTGRDVNQYTLSTAWDISTASYVRVFSVNAQDRNPEGVFFSPDGLNMYVVGGRNRSIYQYVLSLAWNISTATYTQAFSVAAQESAPRGLFFSPDGLNMYMCGISGDDINQYTLSTAWDISTASYARLFDVAVEASDPVGLSFSPDGLNMYIASSSSIAIVAYGLG
jgi:DNA-binding beta-propeller fold protein YncE